MKRKFAFARKVAVGLLAVGFLSCLATDTFAANRTWTNGSSSASGNRGKWGTAFVSNWAGNLVPTTADTAFFGSNLTNTYNVAVQLSTSVGGIRLTPITTASTSGYTFTTNAINVGGQGITNNSGKTVTFGGGVVVGANQTWSGTGAGSAMTFNNVDINGKVLNTSTAATINTLINNASPTTINVQGGDLVVAGGGGPGTQPVNFTVSSGFLTTYNQTSGAGYNAASSDLDVSGTGTYNNTQVGSDAGVTNWDVVTMSGGAIDLMGIGGVLTNNSYTQTGGVIKQYVGWDATALPGEEAVFSSVIATDGAGHNTGPLSFGGALDVDFSGAGSRSFAIGTAWNLFQGVNAGGAAASNFSTALLSNVDPGSPYAGLSFTQYGTEFKTAPGTDGTYLVFQAQNGNLVVVPEPSTIVFAGLGVAMSGWTMWKKRRLSKLLAVKAG